MKTLLLSFMILFTSCGEWGEEPDENAPQIGREFQETGVLSDEEFSTAKAICEAYRDKREFYASGLQDSQRHVNFELESTSCATDLNLNQSTRPYITEGSNYEQFQYVSSLSNFLKDIPTDTHGAISDICEKVLDDEIPSGTAQNSTRKYRYIFEEESTNDQFNYSVETYKENLNTGQWISYIVDTFSVIKKVNSKNLNGKVAERSQTKQCQDQSKNSFIKQSMTN